MSNVVATILRGAFYYCPSIKSIVIPIYVTIIYDNTFSSCYLLTVVVMPYGITEIKDSAFSGGKTQLLDAPIPHSVTSIGAQAFTECYALNVKALPNSLNALNSYVFQRCHKMKSIAIPIGIKTISSMSFSYCYSLTSVVIPSSVTSIGSQAFSTCYALIKYDFSQHTSVPTLSSTNAFSGMNAICKIIVPDSLYDEWIAASNWSTYANYIYKASEVAE